MPATKPVRIPEGTYQSLRTLAGLLGETPGTVLEEAFQEYVQRHQGEIRETFDHAKKYIASNDVDGLTALLGRNRSSRAARAAEAARRAD